MRRFRASRFEQFVKELDAVGRGLSQRIDRSLARGVQAVRAGAEGVAEPALLAGLAEAGFRLNTESVLPNA